MLPYWLLLAVLSFGSVLYQRELLARPAGVIGTDHRMRNDLAFAFIVVALTLMIGLRYEVGGDWNIYFSEFKEVTPLPLAGAIRRLRSEAGYTTLNWLAGQVGLGFWFVNLVCAAIFVTGLTALARQQSNPWLVLVVATPVFIILVGMGYTRQSAGVGCVLIGLTRIIKGKHFLWFVGWALIGALFHQSAILWIPVVALFIFRWTAGSLLLLAATAIISYYVVLPEALDRYAIGYIDVVYEAKGVLFRVIPNAAAGALLLTFRKQFRGAPVELNIWRGFAILSLVALFALQFVKSSIIIDRLSLYILPMQIVVLSALPTAFGPRGQRSLALTAIVIGYTAIQLWAWLTFANHARFWIPYRLYPLS